MRASRPLRISRQALEKRVYHLSGTLPAADENGLAVEIGGDDGADGPSGPGHGGERERVLEGPLLDASALYRTTLLREWLEIAIKPADIVSVQRQDDKEPIVAFQILELSRRIIVVKTYDQHESSAHLWNVQQLEIWRGPGYQREPLELETFTVESTGRVDFLDWMGSAWANRERCRLWKPKVSDLEGCRCYDSPRKLQVELPLSSPRVPVLTLLDALTEKEYVGVMRKHEHMPGGASIFDARRPSRAYLQVVLASEWLFAQGTVVFMSQKSKSYYCLLLKDPTADAEGMSVAECATKVKDLEGLDVRIDVLEAGHVGAVAVPAAPPLPAPPLLPPALPLLDEGVVPADEAAEEAIDGDGDDDDIWPAFVLGARVVSEDRATPGGVWNEGLRVTCPTHGPGCRKFRSKHLRQEVDGRKAALYYLGAWVRGAEGRSAKEHAAFNPRVGEIHAFMASPDCP